MSQQKTKANIRFPTVVGLVKPDKQLLRNLTKASDKVLTAYKQNESYIQNNIITAPKKKTQILERKDYHDDDETESDTDNETKTETKRDNKKREDDVNWMFRFNKSKQIDQQKSIVQVWNAITNLGLTYDGSKWHDTTTCLSKYVLHYPRKTTTTKGSRLPLSFVIAASLSFDPAYAKENDNKQILQQFHYFYSSIVSYLQHLTKDKKISAGPFEMCHFSTDRQQQMGSTFQLYKDYEEFTYNERFWVMDITVNSETSAKCIQEQLKRAFHLVNKQDFIHFMQEQLHLRVTT